MKIKTLAFIFIISIYLPTISIGQNFTCKFVAEISLTSIEKGAFWACTKSANPTACSIALAAHSCGQALACEGLVKEITETGCKYVVKTVGNKLKIIGQATNTQLEELKKTWEALNTVEGIKWIESSFLAY